MGPKDRGSKGLVTRRLGALELPAGGLDDVHDCRAIEAPLYERSAKLCHSSVTVTEKYYGKWCPSQQAILDDALAGAWEKK
jgi:hypothetical protein